VAKNTKIVAKQMIHMADCFDRISAAPPPPDASKVAVEKKLGKKLSEYQRQITDSVQQMLSNFFSRWYRTGIIKLSAV
jgi:hypothetical protein